LEAKVLASMLGWYSISAMIRRIRSFVVFDTSPRLWITRSTVPMETFALCAMSLILVRLIALIALIINDSYYNRNKTKEFFLIHRVRTRKIYFKTFLCYSHWISLQLKLKYLFSCSYTKGLFFA
jgi:hypothetical protein